MLAHNEKTYEELKNYTDNGLDCCVVNPCGSGKTTVMEQFIKDNPNKTFVIFTKQANAERYYRTRSATFKNIDILTYTSMHLLCGDKDYSVFKKDVYIFDEAHYMGAALWRQDIQHLLDKFSPLVVGFTATSQRYEDQGTNNTIVDDFFSGRSAGNFTARQLQKMGVFQEPEYVLSMYDISEDANSYLEKVEESDLSESAKSKYRKEIAAVVKKWEKEYSPDKVLKDRLPDYLYKEHSNRILVYVPNIVDMPKYEENINRILKNVCGGRVKSYKYTYKSSDLILEDFEKDDDSVKIKVMYSIDKIMETIHMDDLNILIMLRPSVSNRIITQQFGRINNINSDKKPIIFDMVGNLNNLNTIMRTAGNRESHDPKTGKKRLNLVNLKFAASTSSIFDAIDNALKRTSQYEYDGIVTSLGQFAEIYKVPLSELKALVKDQGMFLKDAIAELQRNPIVLKNGAYNSQEYIDGIPKEYDFSLTEEQSKEAESYIPMVERFIRNHKITDDDMKQEMYMAMMYAVSKKHDSETYISARILNAMRGRYVAVSKSKVRQDTGTKRMEETDFIFYADMADITISNDLKDTLSPVLQTLSKRELGVLTERFGLNGDRPKTLEDVGKIYGVQRERIRQIESRALRKLRVPSRFRNIKENLYAMESLHACGVECTSVRL